MIENVIATSISRNGFIKIISLLFVAMLINLRTYNDPGSLILKITFSLFDCKYKFFLGCEIKRVRDLDFFITNGGVWKFLLFFLFFSWKIQIFAIESRENVQMCQFIALSTIEL